MAILLPIFLLTAAYLTGWLVRRAFRDPEYAIGETCLLGMLSLFLLWESLVVLGVWKGLYFSMAVRIYSVLLGSLIMFALAVGRKELLKGFADEMRIFRPGSILTFVLILALAALYMILLPDTSNDYTIELVQTILATDKFYGTHPGTGGVLLYPLGMRHRFIGLHSFYAYLVQISDSLPAVVIYRIVPVICILFGGMAYSVLVRAFSPAGKDLYHGTVMAISLVIGLLIFGSLSGSGLFYDGLHRAWKGGNQVFLIWMPYMIALAWELVGRKHWRNIFYMLLMLAAISVMTDPLRGALPVACAGVLCTVIYLLVVCMEKWQRRKKLEKDKKETDIQS